MQIIGEDQILVRTFFKSAKSGLWRMRSALIGKTPKQCLPANFPAWNRLPDSCA
jgi:hypothetical protein